ncbi:hypothetical protein M3T53_00445 [Actinomyces sp. B33]|uniref:hypothetical protein n=1 Tax=Actinomyces sp. B33 TaxID=2942131 RepID=UPI0023401B71|nr:hypothetical protein [Actinomyces sp. B33]MDC4232187.1 hypothetical protein [Actinomyces sp. B33]
MSSDDCIDHLRLYLVAEVVVGHVQAHVHAQLGKPCVQDHPGTDAVGVEVGDDDEWHLTNSEVLQSGTHGVDVLEQRVGGVVNLGEVLVGPSHAFTDDAEQVQAGGAGGELVDVQRFRRRWLCHGHGSPYSS